MAKGTLPRGPLYARPIRPPLARWFDALAARRRGPVDVVCVGDSITEGTGASDRTTRWLDRLQDSLRTAYPTPSVLGGAGYIPCYTMADYPSGWNYGGNIAANGTFGLARRSVVLKSADGFCERYVTGSSVTVAWTSGPGLGSFDVLVDGTVATTVNTGTGAQARGGNRATVTFTRGSHLVRLRWSSGGDCYVNGLFVRDGDETRGLRFTDSGQHGSSSADWSRLVNPATAYIIGDELAVIAPSLVLIGLGPNDMIQGLSPASHKANLLDLIAQVRASVPVDSTGRGVPILLHAAYQLAADYTYPWSSYVQNMIDIAYADAQIDLIDFSTRLARANANPDAMIAADGVHPNDSGHAFYATQLRDKLAPPALPRHDYLATWGGVAQTVTGVKTFADGARVPVPSNAADPVRHDDGRLSNARTPITHASTHASGGSDPVAPAAIGAAADSAVVHNTGAETVNGAKTFSTAPAVPVGTLAAHPVRRDDTRLTDARTPTSHASTHASGGSDPITPASIAAAAASHSHAIADLPVAASGVSSSTALVRADDSRMSNARTPTSHAGTHASGGSDPVTPAAIGAAAAVHAAQHASGGSDPVTPAAIGAATSGHSHSGFMGQFNILDFGAVGNGQGSAADQTGIANAYAAANAVGGTVIWPSGTWEPSAVIDVAENVTTVCTHDDTITYAASLSPCVIRPLASHAGPAVFRMRGSADTGRSADHTGARFRYVTLDGTRTTAANAVRGIMAQGLVREARLEYCTIRNMADTGYWFGVNGNGVSPQSCRLIGCLANANRNNGFTFSNMPDSTLIDCNALGNTNSGFYVAGFMNGKMTDCRSEWNGQHGFALLSGYWGSGQGSGGMTLVGCTSDRNNMNGVYIDAQGAAVLQLTGCTLRRDGRNSGNGGGGYASLQVATTTTMPIVIDNINTYPGVDDGGTGTLSPATGIIATGTAAVVVASGYVHAATTALNVGSGTYVSPNVGTAVGATTGPTRTAPRNLIGSDDTRLSDARTPLAHSHLIADLPVAASGVSSTTALVRADDSRMSNARTPSAHAASHATAGSDPITPASIGAAPAGVSVFDLGTVSSGTLTPSATAPNQKAVITAATQLAVPAAPGDGYLINLTVRSTGATQTLTLAAAYGAKAGQPLSQQIPVGKECTVFMRYNGDYGRFVVNSFTVET